MISSVGSYAVTALSADRSNSALVAIGCPISRLEPWPTISSGCSLAIAAPTHRSTTLASRTFRVSTPSVSRSLYNRIETALFVAAVRSPDHPSKGVADTHKDELDDPQGDSRRQTRSPVRRPTTAATAASSARLAVTTVLRSLSKHFRA